MAESHTRSWLLIVFLIVAIFMWAVISAKQMTDIYYQDDKSNPDEEYMERIGRAINPFKMLLNRGPSKHISTASEKDMDDHKQGHNKLVNADEDEKQKDKEVKQALEQMMLEDQPILDASNEPKKQSRVDDSNASKRPQGLWMKKGLNLKREFSSDEANPYIDSGRIAYDSLL
ncbi:uncharacterized protein LOC115627642 isoform X2 [Scaptodrosophila lebanonensis]|uniref:Uncharacterized protein LOC115627642 isoform X2 n=1 Tax=Drosophila lebanonensis TaxID=7225 RepID=A0A6J2TRF6_DROLE|nr:uncharacterized protein LOC115627642 isoform X2 [Scaptodrosophila lebanonensis]